MTDVLTYDALRGIQYNERKSEKLVELDNSFYGNVEEYLDRKPKDELTEIELRNAKNILKDIYDRRERKILSQALAAVRSGMRIDTKAMTSQEESFFKSLVTLIKDHREIAEKPVKKGAKKEKKPEAEDVEKEIEAEPEVNAPEEQPEQEEKAEIEEDTPTTTYIKVKILQELPEMLGADFNTYGPFKKDEVIEIPEQNAEIFLEKGKAEVIE